MAAEGQHLAAIDFFRILQPYKGRSLADITEPDRISLRLIYPKLQMVLAHANLGIENNLTEILNTTGLEKTADPPRTWWQLAADGVSYVASFVVSPEITKLLETKVFVENYISTQIESEQFKIKIGEKAREKLNSELPGIMELELEDFYKRGLWVAKRTGEFGAKKKYALINHEGKVKIRGFETVRRDWCTLARELQNKILQKILKDGNEKSALEIIKNAIKEIKERKIGKSDIMIRTQLKKPLSEYKAITPHVIAAQKMKEKGLPVDMGMVVEYFIAETREKKALVREKVKLPDEKGEYNIKYYLEHQIIPAVENIFEVFSINIKEIAEGKRQKKLGDFKNF